MCQWGNYQNNLDVWKLIKNNDGEEELSNKSIKLYEIITILSGLCCGSLIGLSNSNNENEIVIYIYDVVRGYGIISSVFSGVVSVGICSLISSLSFNHTYLFIEKTIQFSTIPLLTTIISLVCLVICTSLHFKMYVLFATLPYTVFVIIFSFYFFGYVYNVVYQLSHSNELLN